MRIGRRVRDAILVACAVVLTQGAPLAQPRDEVLDRGVSMVARGDCAGGWDVLWPKARAGDAQAKASLAQAMRQYRLVPPGSSRDLVSWYRHAVIMSLHGMGTADRLDAQDVGRLVNRTKFLWDREFDECLSSASSPAACADKQIDRRLVPSWENYIAEINALSAAGMPAACTAFGPRREIDDQYVIEYAPDAWQFWEYDRERATNLYESGRCGAATRIWWDWIAFGQPQAAVQLLGSVFWARYQVQLFDDVISYWKYILMTYTYALPGNEDQAYGTEEQRENGRNLIRSMMRSTMPAISDGHTLISCVETNARSPEACLRSAVQAGLLPSPRTYVAELMRASNRFRAADDLLCKE